MLLNKFRVFILILAALILVKAGYASHEEEFQKASPKASPPISSYVSVS